MTQLTRFIRQTLTCALVLMLAACATSGQTFTQMQTGAPMLAANNGRIYVYRTSILGAAIQPSVKLDSTVVGDAVPQGYFFIDRPAGNYKISTETEVDRMVSLTLEPGQIRYVRLDPTFGFFVGHISPVLVDNQQGEKEIKDCHYTGKP